MSDKIQSAPQTSGIQRMNGRGPNQLTSINGRGQMSRHDTVDGSSSGLSIKQGRVVDVWSKQGIVVVQCGGCNMIRCGTNMATNGIVTGVTDVSIPAIGETVLIAIVKGTTFGAIICAFPSFNKTHMPHAKMIKELEEKSEEFIDAKTYGMDKNIFPGNQCGPIFDDYVPGEKYILSEHLTGMIFSKLFCRMQAADLCQITLNYQDQMADIAMHNMRLWNSGFFLESVTDFGHSDLGIHINAHLNDAVTEEEPDRRRKSTHRIWAGWLASGFHLYSQYDKGEGEPSSDVWLDDLGTIALRTLGSSYHQKVDTIYVPIRKVRADDPNDKGDIMIDGKEIREPFIMTPSASEQMAWGCQARDYIAYLTGSEKYHFGRYKPYEKDWEKITKPANKGERPKIDKFWGIYGKEYEIKAPEDSERKGDQNKARVGDAFCGVLADGSILLRDAWGSQIEMRGGRIVISGANDTEITSGRDTTIICGNDAIIKAQNHCEMVAIKKDIRIRCKKMMMIDSKEGGVQITAPMKKGAVSLDEKGEQYKSAFVTIKARNVDFFGEKVRVTADKLFAVKGHTHDKPPQVKIRHKGLLFWSEKSQTAFKTGTDPHAYVVISKGSIAAGENIFTEKWNITGKGYLTNGGIIALKGGVTNRSKNWGKMDPPMDDFEIVDFCEMVEPQFEVDIWDKADRILYEPDDVKKIKYKHRTTDDYKSEESKWLQKFWQRQYADSSSLKPIDYGDDKDEEEENSFPGKKHIDGDLKNLIFYEEVNVDKWGDPVHPKEHKPEGGTFTDKAFKDQLFKKT